MNTVINFLDVAIFTRVRNAFNFVLQIYVEANKERVNKRKRKIKYFHLTCKCVGKLLSR